jgi:hypothetical protein
MPDGPITHTRVARTAPCARRQRAPSAACRPLHARRQRRHAVRSLIARSIADAQRRDRARRSWGVQRNTSTGRLAEALRVLRPIAHEVQTFVPRPQPLACMRLANPRGRCVAHDCGRFTCGCYLPHCTHCEVSTYVPMHEHNRRCFAMLARHEQARPAPPSEPRPASRAAPIARAQWQLSVCRAAARSRRAAAAMSGSSSFGPTSWCA